MLTRTEVETVSRAQIVKTFQAAPSFKEYLLHPDRFPIWVQLLTQRLAQIERLGILKGTAGQTRSALLGFVRQGTLVYAEKQLAKVEKKIAVPPVA